MSNIGREIRDFYCNGFAGGRYDLEGSRIEAETADYIVIRTKKGEPVMLSFFEDTQEGEIGSNYANKQQIIDIWCSEKKKEG